MTKTCHSCVPPTSYPITEFHYKSKKRGTRQDRCKTCMRKAAKEHYVANKPELLDKRKKELSEQRAKNRELVKSHVLANPCSKCGATNPGILKVSLTPAQINQSKPETLVSLLAGCTVLCLNCRG